MLHTVDLQQFNRKGHLFDMGNAGATHKQGFKDAHACLHGWQLHVGNLATSVVVLASVANLASVACAVLCCGRVQVSFDNPTAVVDQQLEQQVACQLAAHLQQRLAGYK